MGVFQSCAEADRAVADLKAAGYRDDQIGLIGKDDRGNTVRTGADGESNAGEGAAIGAAAGAIGGAAVGAGHHGWRIPVVGPVLALGTLGTILVNAAGGAVIVGIAGRADRLGHSRRGCRLLRERGQGGPISRNGRVRL